MASSSVLFPPAYHSSSNGGHSVYKISSLLRAKRQALDDYRHKTLSFHQLTDIDKIQFGQIDLINAGKIPFRRKYAAHDSTYVLLENQSNRPIHRRQARYGFIDTPGQLLHHAITKKWW